MSKNKQRSISVVSKTKKGLRKFNKSSFVFTNADCIEFYSFVGRGLNFMLSHVQKVDFYEKYFHADLFHDVNARKTGQHRFMTLPEFILVGVIKILNNFGFPMQTAADIVLGKIFPNHPLTTKEEETAFINYFCTLPSIYIYVKRNDGPYQYLNDSLKIRDIDLNHVHLVMMKSDEASIKKIHEVDPMIYLRIDLMAFQNHLSRFLEKYEQVDYEQSA